jgi:hypothetical protein
MALVAEANLILDRPNRARQWYQDAVQRAGKNKGQIALMQRNVQLLCTCAFFFIFIFMFLSLFSQSTLTFMQLTAFVAMSLFCACVVWHFNSQSAALCGCQHSESVHHWSHCGVSRANHRSAQQPDWSGQLPAAPRTRKSSRFGDRPALAPLRRHCRLCVCLLRVKGNCCFCLLLCRLCCLFAKQTIVV